MMSPVRSAELKVGIDIGGTKIAGGVVDSRGHIVEKLRIDTAELAQAVIDMADHLLATHEAVAVGVAAAELIDKDRATVIHAPNIAWRGEPLKATLEAGIPVPVTIENDANAAAWAEFRFGARVRSGEADLQEERFTRHGVAFEPQLRQPGHEVVGVLSDRKSTIVSSACPDASSAASTAPNTSSQRRTEES